MLAHREQVARAYVIDDSTSKVMEVKARMAEHLDSEQSRTLSKVLDDVFGFEYIAVPNDDLLRRFVDAKAIEGCTKNTIRAYVATVSEFDRFTCKPFATCSADDVRSFLASKDCSAVTLNNNRRNLSSFFGWLESEDLIDKSPMRKIKAIREEKRDKMPFSGEEIERMRNACQNLRDRAIIEVLMSSGMRVGELVGLKLQDLDMEHNQCTVFGKGKKYRKCYLTDAAIYHLRRYLESRSDSCDSVFVTLQNVNGDKAPIEKGGVEQMIRSMGLRCGVQKAHPHRFRRTMATNAISKGMPIEQVQMLLGHSNIETTTIYAKVSQENVKHNALRLM